MIIKYTQEEFMDSDEFAICEEIYLDKFFAEENYSLENISNLTFYIYKLNEIIGFGFWQKNSVFELVDVFFKDEWEYSEKHIELFNYIIDEVKKSESDLEICLYQTYEEDCEFYRNLGFNLYKDYGDDWFLFGKDVTRFILRG